MLQRSIRVLMASLVLVMMSAPLIAEDLEERSLQEIEDSLEMVSSAVGITTEILSNMGASDRIIITLLAIQFGMNLAIFLILLRRPPPR